MSGCSTPTPTTRPRSPPTCARRWRSLAAGPRATGGQGRVIAVFQPHLYSRTRIFAAEFGAALGLADEVVVLDVYAAREDPEPGVTGRLVADAVPGGPVFGGSVRYVADFGDVPKVVAALAAPGDLVLTMGAGDITRMGPLVLAEIANSAPGPGAQGPAAHERHPAHRVPRRDAGRGRDPGGRDGGRAGGAAGDGGAGGRRGTAPRPRGRRPGPAGARPSSRSRGSRSSAGLAGRCSVTGCSSSGRSPSRERTCSPPAR